MISPQPLETPLTTLLGIAYPIIMAPMFLVSDVNMVVAATKAGITGAIPALNYRNDKEFRNALTDLKDQAHGPIGINLIANKSNLRLREQLQTCLNFKVNYVITSLGNPLKIVQKCHEAGIYVFCDVIDEEFGKKASEAKPDALIAVNKDAGGHAGRLESKVLISKLKEITDIPVISAGGVGTGQQLYSKLIEGACGVSIGSPFIATTEAPVSQEYKMACVNYKAKDIVMTTKLSGTPCTVINTPYVQKTGTDQNYVEAILNKNKRFKKIVKALTFYKGMKALKNAAFSSTYRNVWCAGPSIEYVTEIVPIENLVKKLVAELETARAASM